jgi:hypothetical protein
MQIQADKKKPKNIVVERMLIPVQVHPTIREFIIDTHGSDVVVPDKYSLFWKTIKYNLETPPANYHEPLTRDNIIYVGLLDSSGTASLVRKRDKITYINSLFRWYLSPEAQEEIAFFFRKQFKHTFHCFMQGAVAANPKVEQRKAMEDFCRIYNLTLNEISEDMLKKSWDRSEHKKSVISTKKNHCPLFF